MGTIFASDTPKTVLEEAAGRHQRQQHGISEPTTVDLVNFLHQRVCQQSVISGIPHLDGDSLFGAFLASGVKILDFGA